MPVTAADVDNAFERLRDVAILTPLHVSHRLSEVSGANLWLKREDLQPVRSYKIRGAYNFIAQLTPEQRLAGVVCASAGNHGEGVSLACAKLGVVASVFVPTTTTWQKRELIVALGQGLVVLVVVGDDYDDSSWFACETADRTGMTMVPAFDDPRTIAGQGTIAREIVAQLGRAPDVVIVPVGAAAWLRAF